MSLLKRIEQGQGGQGATPSQPSGSGGQSGGDSSRLSSIQARRVSAPITSPQAGSYFDLKTRVQNKLQSDILRAYFSLLWESQTIFVFFAASPFLFAE